MGLMKLKNSGEYHAELNQVIYFEKNKQMYSTGFVKLNYIFNSDSNSNRKAPWSTPSKNWIFRGKRSLSLMINQKDQNLNKIQKKHVGCIYIHKRWGFKSTGSIFNQVFAEIKRT